MVLMPLGSKRKNRKTTTTTKIVIPVVKSVEKELADSIKSNTKYWFRKV